MALKKWQSTAAQASYADALAQKVGDDFFAEAFRRAARLNGNKEWGGSAETRIRAVRRLTKKAASQLIGELKEQAESLSI
jgi:hypothetical protein